MSFDERITHLIADSVREHPAMRNKPIVVTDYIVLAEFSDAQADARVFLRTQNQQREHRTLGLLDFGLTLYRERLVEIVLNDDEGDDEA